MKHKLIIVTGLSGAGLSTVIHTLQDNGFYCIDNLPIELLWETIKLIEGDDLLSSAGFALGMDIRSSHFAGIFPKIKDDLMGRVQLDVIFIRAEHEILEERYSTARRRHPLTDHATSLRQQIEREEQLLKPVEDAADARIDTSFLTAKELRHVIEKRYSHQDGLPLRSLQLILVSFGFKYQPMTHVEGLFDVRFLPNPYFDPSLKDFNGMDQAVQDYVLKSDDAQTLLSQMMEYLRFVMPKYLAEGRHFIRMGIGCTGGCHRSVTFVEKIAEDLHHTPIPGVLVSKIHRDVHRGA